MPDKNHKVKIQSVTPPLVTTLGNDSVRIVGRHLERVSDVRIDGTYIDPWRHFDGQQARRVLSFIMPPVPAGIHRITLVTPDGQTATALVRAVEPDSNTPRITHIEPFMERYSADTSPYYYRSATFRVRGHNFKSAKAVYMDGVRLRFRVLSDTSLEVHRRRQNPRNAKYFLPREVMGDATFFGYGAGRYVGPQRLARVPIPNRIHGLDVVVLSHNSVSPLFQILSSQRRT